MHHDLDVHPITKDKEAMFINEPWLVDRTCTYMETRNKEPDDEPDNLRIFVPIDLNRKSILRRLSSIIVRYGEANEENEFSFGSDVDMLVYQIEIYDQRWYVRNMKQAIGKHSREAVELVREFVALLEEIPDGCAECFPFETIDKLKEEYLEEQAADR